MSASKELKAIGLTRAKAAKFCGKNPDTLRNWYMDNYALFEIVKAGLEVKLNGSVNRSRRFIIFDIE